MAHGSEQISNHGEKAHIWIRNALNSCEIQKFGIGMFLIMSSPDFDLESDKLIRQDISLDLPFFWRERYRSSQTCRIRPFKAL